MQICTKGPPREEDEIEEGSHPQHFSSYEFQGFLEVWLELLVLLIDLYAPAGTQKTRKEDKELQSQTTSNDRAERDHLKEVINLPDIVDWPTANKESQCRDLKHDKREEL